MPDGGAGRRGSSVVSPPSRALRDVRERLRDYLTFYHEVLIPRNPFFDIGANRNSENSLLVITSPSRMGNHVILSALDGHPELPRVPGEDGFLAFSFAAANRDLHDLIASFRGPDVVDFMTHLGSNGHRDKWRAFKSSYEEGRADLDYSGVGVEEAPHVLDFEGIVFDVDYEAYVGHLEECAGALRSAETYTPILQCYLDALGLLLPDSNRSVYDSYLVFGGMRRQAEWLCETYEKVKILCSLRSFPSYCVSHVKAREGDVELTSDRVREAWEHWYHKVLDMLYLKLRYPEKVGIVTFEDLTRRPEAAHRGICRFLGVEYHESMATATINGIPVRGNSWQGRPEEDRGSFYQPRQTLDAERVPPEHAAIWPEVNRLRVNADSDGGTRQTLSR